MDGETKTEQPAETSIPPVVVSLRTDNEELTFTPPVEVDSQREEEKDAEIPYVEVDAQGEEEKDADIPYVEVNLETDIEETPSVEVSPQTHKEEFTSPVEVDAQTEDEEKEGEITSREANPHTDKEETPPVEDNPHTEGNGQDQTPVPTDSMVTVPLSTGLSSGGHNTPDRRESSVPEEWLNAEKRTSTDSAVLREQEKKEEGENDEKTETDDEDEGEDDKPSEEGTVVYSSRPSGQWSDSERRSSVEFFAPDNQPSSMRNSVTPSKSSSCTSRNSPRSDGGDQTPDADVLDWIELEKTEELESKADPDDDVRHPILFIYILWFSIYAGGIMLTQIRLRLCYSQDSTRRIMPWRPTPSPAYPATTPRLGGNLAHRRSNT